MNSHTYINNRDVRPFNNVATQTNNGLTETTREGRFLPVRLDTSVSVGVERKSAAPTAGSAVHAGALVASGCSTTTQMKTYPNSNSRRTDSQVCLQLTETVDRFDRVLPPMVKSKSPHGREICSNLTDLTEYMWSKRSVRDSGRSLSNCEQTLSPNRIGQIGQMGSGPSAVSRFLVDQKRSNAGQIASVVRSNRLLGSVGVAA